MIFSGGIVSILAAFISGVVGPILVRLIIRKIEHKHDPLNEAFTLGEKVEDKLEHLMEIYECDRMYILQFHNGGHYYPTGKSIQKFSMFYELVKENKYSIRNVFQNIPVHLFSKSLKQLSTENYIAIPDYRNPAIATYGLKYIAEEGGTASAYLFTIKSIDDKLIGVMGMDYIHKRELSQQDIHDLELEVAVIGGELSKYLKR